MNVEGCVGEVVSINLKWYSKLHQEKYMSHDRRRISQLQTTALQPSLAKPFTEIRSKVVPYFYLSL